MLLDVASKYSSRAACACMRWVRVTSGLFTYADKNKNDQTYVRYQTFVHCFLLIMAWFQWPVETKKIEVETLDVWLPFLVIFILYVGLGLTSPINLAFQISEALPLGFYVLCKPSLRNACEG